MVFISIKNELAARTFNIGCRYWVPVFAGCPYCGWLREGVGAIGVGRWWWCCELARRIRDRVSVCCCRALLLDEWPYIF